MPEVMRAIVAAVLMGLSVPAFAEGRSLQVTVRVAPSDPAPTALASLPAPPGSRSLTATKFGGSFYHGEGLQETALFYQRELPKAGYHLVRTTAEGSESIWERADARLEVHLSEVIGAAPATRIVVWVSARPGARPT